MGNKPIFSTFLNISQPDRPISRGPRALLQGLDLHAHEVEVVLPGIQSGEPSGLAVNRPSGPVLGPIGPIRPIGVMWNKSDIWSIYGLYMDYIWIIYGLYMDYIWIIYGLYMDYMIVYDIISLVYMDKLRISGLSSGLIHYYTLLFSQDG